MKYSEKQIKYILNDASRSAHDAILRGGEAFIKDVSLAPGAQIGTVKMTFRGTPIDLCDDEENMKRAKKVLGRIYRTESRRLKVREFFQKVSDTLTCNYNLSSLSDDEISALFALNKMGNNKDKVKCGRVGYMYKMKFKNIELSHIPSEAGMRTFVVSFRDKLTYISKGKSNSFLYNRASALFFDIYSKKIAPKHK